MFLSTKPISSPPIVLMTSPCQAIDLYGPWTKTIYRGVKVPVVIAQKIFGKGISDLGTRHSERYNISLLIGS